MLIFTVTLTVTLYDYLVATFKEKYLCCFLYRICFQSFCMSNVMDLKMSNSYCFSTVEMENKAFTMNCCDIIPSVKALKTIVKLVMSAWFCCSLHVGQANLSGRLGLSLVLRINCFFSSLYPVGDNFQDSGQYVDKGTYHWKMLL